MVRIYAQPESKEVYVHINLKSSALELRDFCCLACSAGRVYHSLAEPDSQYTVVLVTFATRVKKRKAEIKIRAFLASCACGQTTGLS